YKVLEKTADSAKVEFSFEKAPKRTVTFKKMEGSWLPQEAEEGLSQLALAKAYLDGMDKAAIDELRSSMRTGLMMANGFLGPLANAKTQQEFSAAFEPLAAPVIQQMQSAIARQTGMGQGGMPGMGPGMSPGMGSMPMPAP
ncbi:MAG: hypothetical protein IT423_17260, partial [Pirellulaceae bacterium]|nr:hypothetical protein [Pirellulaceae bacterium]